MMTRRRLYMDPGCDQSRLYFVEGAFVENTWVLSGNHPAPPRETLHGQAPGPPVT